nr:hypothetical protein [Methylorubrum zatmanii]
MGSLSKISFGLLAEKWLPLLSGATAACLCVAYKDIIVSTFTSQNFSLPQLYTAIFGWASITTGFLFGVYGLIISKTDGFINQVRDTKVMGVFLSYTSRAVILGFVLTILGMPFLVANVDMKDITNFGFWMGSSYIGLFIYSFIATARVAYLFSILVRVPNRTRLPA